MSNWRVKHNRVLPGTKQQWSSRYNIGYSPNQIVHVRYILTSIMTPRLSGQNCKLHCLTIGQLHDDVILLQLPESLIL